MLHEQLETRRPRNQCLVELEIDLAWRGHHRICRRCGLLQRGVGVINFYALAAGFLTGKYRTKADLEGAQRGGMAEGYFSEDGLRVVEAVQAELDAITALGRPALAVDTTDRRIDGQNLLPQLTGGGAIALAVKAACPRAQVTAVDFSADALAVAIGCDPGKDDIGGLRYGKVVILADADAAGKIDWNVSVDATICRAHQHGTNTTRPEQDTGGRVESQEPALHYEVVRP